MVDWKLQPTVRGLGGADPVGGGGGVERLMTTTQLEPVFVWWQHVTSDTSNVLGSESLWWLWPSALKHHPRAAHMQTIPCLVWQLALDAGSCSRSRVHSLCRLGTAKHGWA